MYNFDIKEMSEKLQEKVSKFSISFLNKRTGSSYFSTGSSYFKRNLGIQGLNKFFASQSLCPMFVTQTKVSSSTLSHRKYRDKRHLGCEINLCSILEEDKDFKINVFS